MIQQWHAAKGTALSDPANGCYVKDMHQVRELVNVPPHVPVVALDDHPENIVNGHVGLVGPACGGLQPLARTPLPPPSGSAHNVGRRVYRDLVAPCLPCACLPLPPTRTFGVQAIHIHPYYGTLLCRAWARVCVLLLPAPRLTFVCPCPPPLPSSVPVPTPPYPATSQSPSTSWRWPVYLWRSGTPNSSNCECLRPVLCSRFPGQNH
jgi:hypothetical protein